MGDYIVHVCLAKPSYFLESLLHYLPGKLIMMTRLQEDTVPSQEIVYLHAKLVAPGRSFVFGTVGVSIFLTNCQQEIE